MFVEHKCQIPGQPKGTFHALTTAYHNILYLCWSFLPHFSFFALCILHGPYNPFVSLRVQEPNNHILTQNLYYNYYYPKPKYLIIGYMDPLGLFPQNLRSQLWTPNPKPTKPTPFPFTPRLQTQPPKHPKPLNPKP